MVKADLHIHSSFSAHPSEWFLQRLGTRESYSTPERIYHEARKRGMDFVTITDHNEIAASLLLKEKYPQSVITGVEVTTYFPENGCKIHVLVYGLTEAQYRMLNKVRPDIYELRQYIKEQNLAHTVAHPTFSINRKLTIEYIERLLLLFDYFEGINGSRSRIGNEIFMNVVTNITPEIIDTLFAKYHIEPYSETPWIKGLTGGSDDHSGLFIGRTYTCVEAETPEAFVEQLKCKNSSVAGRHNDYQGLAFAIYKIAYEFSKTRSKVLSSSLFHSINQLIFEQEAMDWKKRLMFGKMKFSREAREDTIKRLFFELIDTFQQNKDLTIETKLIVVYQKISEIADEFFKLLLVSIEKDIHQGDIISLIKNISGSIPGVFLSLPFFSTINMLHGSRTLLNELSRTYGNQSCRKARKILWLTDGIEVLTVSKDAVTQYARSTYKDDPTIIPALCLPQEEDFGNFMPDLINLPFIYEYTPSFSPSCTLRFPSILTSLRMIYDAAPDEIFISTPGPVGLLGLLAAKLLHVNCTGIYHADVIYRTNQAIGDEKVCRVIDDFTRWFYSCADTLGVPSKECMDTLTKAGYNKDKMSLCSMHEDVFIPPYEKPCFRGKDEAAFFETSY
jgi:hypothetical protein